MDEENDLKPRVLSFVHKNLFILSLIAVSVSLIGIGLFQYLKPSEVKVDFIKTQNSEAIAGEKAVSSKIVVDISGSVQSPGVYELPEGSRLKDALIAAGGLASGADRNYVAKKMNLAQKLTDGAKIYIPASGETVFSVSNITNSSGDTSSSLVNINTASQVELESLPKIGPTTAKKIIDGRPYNTTSELVSKKAVSQKIYDAIVPLITIL